MTPLTADHERVHQQVHLAPPAEVHRRERNSQHKAELSGAHPVAFSTQNRMYLRPALWEATPGLIASQTAENTQT